MAEGRATATPSAHVDRGGEAGRRDADYGLTDKQRETLLMAYREGYFDDPRRVSLEELSETFGISPRAVSQRLRRGVYSLVGNTVANDR